MIDISPQPCCKNCPFYEQVVDHMALGKSEGECRRYPPQSVAVHAAGKVQVLSHFARVQSTWICGEHPAFQNVKRAARKPPEVTEQVVSPAD